MSGLGINISKTIGSVLSSMVSIAPSFGSRSSERVSGSADSIEASDDPDNDPSNTEDSMLEIHKELTASEKSNIPGVVSVKIKQLSIDTGLLSAQESFSSVYCLLQHRNWQARTTVVHDYQGKSRFDQVKHFPVNVVTNRAHPFNLVRLDIIGVGQHGVENRVGGILFHMHDIITGTPLAKEFQIAGESLMIGRITMELTFNYGSFGYGMDRQLLEDTGTSEDFLQYSLFPRINPDEEEVYENGYVIKSRAIPHPNFIPFEKKVYLSYGSDLKIQLEVFSKTMEPRTSFDAGMKKTNAVRQHYYKIDDRSARLRWLHSYLQRSHNREEIVAEPGNQYKEEEFPSKTYVRFLKPLTIDREEMAVQIEPELISDYSNRHQILHAITVQEMDMRTPSQNDFASKLQRKFSSFLQTARDEVV